VANLLARAIVRC